MGMGIAMKNNRKWGQGSYIAIDWGTSSRRIYLIDADGNIRAEERSSAGAASVKSSDYPAIIAGIRHSMGFLPVIAAGMVGSRIGWMETPYVQTPAGIETIADNAIYLRSEDVILLPGVAHSAAGRVDVMRGEEIQALGAWISGAVSANALLCQPGTHNKWIRLRDGKIERFTTVMTGELFALLRGKGTLAPFLQEPVQDDEHFQAGVAAAGSGRAIGAALFHARAATLLGDLPAGGAASYVSGLLIGSDIMEGRSGQERLNIIASDELSRLYLSAARHMKLSARPIQTALAFTSGVHMIWKQLPLCERLSMEDNGE